jgi:hypothetical protein
MYDKRTATRPKFCFTGKSPKNLPQVPVRVKIISLVRKPDTIEEQGPEQSCLFRRRDYREKGNILKRTALGCSLNGGEFSVLATKFDRNWEPADEHPEIRNDQNFSLVN